MLHLRSVLLVVVLHSQAGSCLLAAPAARLHRSVAPQLRRAPVPLGIATFPDVASSEPIAPEDEWIAKVDVPAFKADIKALGDRLEKGQGAEDVAHLEKIIRWSNFCGAVGVMTCWMRPNPVRANLTSATSATSATSTTFQHHRHHPHRHRHRPHHRFPHRHQVSIVALSTWTLSRWTMIGHHVCHGGYNRQDDGTGRFTSGGFAVGDLKTRVSAHVQD